MPKLALLTTVACGLVMVGCSREQPGQAGAGQPNASTLPDAPAASNFAASEPRVGGPTGYVGSLACRDCHQKEYSSWHRTFHRSMTQFPAADTVQADFNHVTLTNANARFLLTRTNDEFWVRMERLPARGFDAASVPPADARIGLLTGSHHMQVFWVPSEQGNAQIRFPFTWLIPERRWVPRKSTFVRPPDAPHLSELWNVSCSRCHTTAVEPRVDRVHYVADTRVGELGIACEACHGPGQGHVEARRADKEKGTVASDVLRREITQPKEIDPLRTSQICGFCHSMKWIDKAEHWRERGFRYRPGDDLEETTPIIRPASASKIPALAAYLKDNPDFLRDSFWPDGMVRVSGRDYNGLIESPCYKGGHFSCLSCHSMHKSEPDGLLAANRTGNTACTQCHDQFVSEQKLPAHTRHTAGSPGSACYNCHMPRTTYGVLKAIRSHQVSSPRVTDQLATGRPNACNLCHLDRSLAWTAEYLQRWFGQPKPELSDPQRKMSDAVRLALTGDAGQRALLAWHFGWDDAIQISGRAWIAPVLGQLLDDPYAAVRCIAERSLRRISNALPNNYDFALEPAHRPPAREAVWERWRKEAQAEPGRSWPSQTLVDAQAPAAMQTAFDSQVRQRDERPVRLRE